MTGEYSYGSRAVFHALFAVGVSGENGRLPAYRAGHPGEVVLLQRVLVGGPCYGTVGQDFGTD
jgi:hypothetical protein